MYGGLYWETIPERDYSKMLDSMLFIDLKDEYLGNEHDLSKFMSKHMQLRDPYHLPQWRIYLKENYGPSSSLFIIKIHHALCDGQGLVSFMSRLADENLNFLPPSLRNPTLLEKMWVYSGLPASLLRVAYLFLFNRPD